MSVLSPLGLTVLCIMASSRLLIPLLAIFLPPVLAKRAERVLRILRGPRTTTLGAPVNLIHRSVRKRQPEDHSFSAAL